MPDSVLDEHVPHGMKSLHTLVVQQLLADEHEKSEFWPRDGCASAQHFVAAIVFGTEELDDRASMDRDRHGKSL